MNLALFDRFWALFCGNCLGARSLHITCVPRFKKYVLFKAIEGFFERTPFGSCKILLNKVRCTGASPYNVVYVIQKRTPLST